MYSIAANRRRYWGTVEPSADVQRFNPGDETTRKLFAGTPCLLATSSNSSAAAMNLKKNLGGRLAKLNIKISKQEVREQHPKQACTVHGEVLSSLKQV